MPRCSKFQPLSQFDAAKRSCAASLASHNARRRREGEKSKSKSKSPGTSSPHAGGTDDTASVMQGSHGGEDVASPVPRRGGDDVASPLHAPRPASAASTARPWPPSLTAASKTWLSGSAAQTRSQRLQRPQQQLHITAQPLAARLSSLPQPLRRQL